MTTDIVNRREFAPIVIQPLQELLDKVQFDLADAADFDVCSASMAEEAQTIIGRLSTVHDELDAQRLATTLPLRDGAAWVNEGFKPALAALSTNIADLKEKLKGWNKEVAKKKAEAEALERKTRALAAAKAETAANVAREAATRLVTEANQSADPHKAAELMDRAGTLMDAARAAEGNAQAELALPVTTGIVSGVKGASTKWKARLDETDHDAWAKFLLVAANKPELRACLRIDESGLNIYAAATKGQAVVPGIVFYTEDTIRTSKKAV